MRLGRRVPGAVSFPADHGFIRETGSTNGDPLGALVLLDEPTFSGVCLTARRRLLDDRPKQLEPNVICVPVHDPSFDNIDTLDQVPAWMLDEIRQFFDTYKQYDDGDPCHTDHFDDQDAALHVIHTARKQHRDKH